MGAHEVVVVGAGVAGLTAATRLRAAGRPVRLFDKASTPGGRLASRATPRRRVATGATHVAVADDEVAAVLARWGAVTEPDGRCRLDPVELGRAAAAGLTIERALVTALDVHRDVTGVVLEGGSRTVSASSVVCTPPVPQTRRLLARSDLPAPEELARVTYTPRLVLLAELEVPVQLPPVPRPPLERWHDGAGGTGAPTTSLVAHATVARSGEDRDDDATMVHARLLEAVRDQLPQATVVWSDLKRWRYATVARRRADGTHHHVAGTGVWLAGDGLVGDGQVAATDAGSQPGIAATDAGSQPGIAAAVRSGLDVARAVLEAQP